MAEKAVSCLFIIGGHLEGFHHGGDGRDNFICPFILNTTLIDGTRIAGLNGLREYLMTSRRHDVVRQFCRKLLGYALGREIMLSDEPLLGEMLRQLERNDYRFNTAVATIVSSRQFLQIRGSRYDESSSSNPRAR